MSQRGSASLRHRVGVDLVEIERIARLVRDNPGVEATIFTARELSYCHRSSRSDDHLAARFAGKEAVLKALGLPPDMEWTDIEIVPEDTGRPVVHLHGRVQDLAKAAGLVQLDVSLSHCAGLALAQALAVSSEPG